MADGRSIPRTWRHMNGYGSRTYLWVDKNLGDRIVAVVHAKQGEKDPKAAGQANQARRSLQAKA